MRTNRNTVNRAAQAGAGSEQRSEHERQIADRHCAEPQDDLSRPLMATNPTHDAPHLARFPMAHRDDAIAGLGAVGARVEKGHGRQDSTGGEPWCCAFSVFLWLGEDGLDRFEDGFAPDDDSRDSNCQSSGSAGLHTDRDTNPE
jgi:hypothetical protein